MLPTFVIGLREGLEAALIVGIIAAFLRKQGRRDLLRWVLAGVAVAITLCVAAGVALELYSRNLAQTQQEGLETVIGALAVGMVTYMVVWMRRNSRNLKGQLEGLAADAMTGRSSAARAMVLMAFLAVIREGLETVVFLLAAFNESSSSSSAGIGVVLGIGLAIALGYGIYRGGVRINLSKFFRATGLVLVLVAAGIVVNALHTAHEAGWLEVGQGSTVDLSWLVAPGSVQASLLTGMLGVQPAPVVIEVIGWLVYLIPVGLYVAWPPGRPAPARLAARIGLAVGVVAIIGAVALTVARPAATTPTPTTSGAGVSATTVSRDAQGAVVRTEGRDPVAGTTGALTAVRLRDAGATERDGLQTERYVANVPVTDAGQGRPATLTLSRIAALNNAVLPLGTTRDADGSIPVTYRATNVLTVWLDARTGRVIDLAWTERVTAAVQTASDTEALARPVAAADYRLPAGALAHAVTAARADHSALDRRSVFGTLAAWLTALAIIALLTALGFALAARRRPEQAAVAPARVPAPART